MMSQCPRARKQHTHRAMPSTTATVRRRVHERHMHPQPLNITSLQPQPSPVVPAVQSDAMCGVAHERGNCRKLSRQTK